ncbi:MAG: hypothetical protein MJY52_01375 [Bacteroidaceae bacterium]|nr:hypothetical protein [Bacteroidaceae bacterium]
MPRCDGRRAELNGQRSTVNTAIKPTAQNISLSTLGTSTKAIKARLEGKKPVVVAPSEPTEKHSEPFTNEDLHLKWIEMCDLIPAGDRAHAERMKLMSVKIGNFPEINIAVANKIMMKYMLQQKSRFEATLRQTLKNDDLTIVYTQDDNKVTKTKGYTTTEIWKMMTDENPAIAKLRSTLHLELS